jgi:hypothetical protein
LPTDSRQKNFRGYIITPHFESKSLVELGVDPMYWGKKNRLLSALQIVGTLEISARESALFPTCDFDLAQDVGALPMLQAVIDCSSSQGIKNLEMRKDQAIHQMMAIITQRIIPELSIFRGYFGLFTMITFASHYLIGLSSTGLLTKNPKFRRKGLQLFPIYFLPFPVERFTRPICQSVFILILTNCEELGGSRRKDTRNSRATRNGAGRNRSDGRCRRSQGVGIRRSKLLE